jgi:hypothetical protein
MHNCRADLQVGDGDDVDCGIISVLLNNLYNAWPECDPAKIRCFVSLCICHGIICFCQFCFSFKFFQLQPCRPACVCCAQPVGMQSWCALLCSWGKTLGNVASNMCNVRWYYTYGRKSAHKAMTVRLQLNITM